MEVLLTALQLTDLVVNSCKNCYFYELSQCFNLEVALQTNGITESDVKEAIKKLIENAPKQIDGKKTQMMKIIGWIRPMLTEIWKCIVRIIFYSSWSSWTHFKLDSSAQIFKVLAFEVILLLFPVWSYLWSW